MSDDVKCTVEKCASPVVGSLKVGKYNLPVCKTHTQTCLDLPGTYAAPLKVEYDKEYEEWYHELVESVLSDYEFDHPEPMRISTPGKFEGQFFITPILNDLFVDGSIDHMFFLGMSHAQIGLLEVKDIHRRLFVHPYTGLPFLTPDISHVGIRHMADGRIKYVEYKKEEFEALMKEELIHEYEDPYEHLY